MLICIQNEINRLHTMGLLKWLLLDKTTKKNILWATDAYQGMGAEYERDREITAELITGVHSDVIKTRAGKELEQQSERTRQHAEVFTPMWVCNKMNNYADEVWFGEPYVFNWYGVPTNRVLFPKHKRWKTYVDSRRLEITCGEAPYLVSRYDVSTGELIPIRRRIGILDRKLRVVNEQTETETDWLIWALRAFQATYGYEFQGDNLLIARINLLMTIEDYMLERWKRCPTLREYRRWINVIVWNLWQMDGLTGTIPYCSCTAAEQDPNQCVIDGWPSDEEPAEDSAPPCRIRNWRGNKSVEFNGL